VSVYINTNDGQFTLMVTPPSVSTEGHVHATALEQVYTDTLPPTDVRNGIVISTNFVDDDYENSETEYG
jgi:hypothetical protein